MYIVERRYCVLQYEGCVLPCAQGHRSGGLTSQVCVLSLFIAAISNMHNTTPTNDYQSQDPALFRTEVRAITSVTTVHTSPMYVNTDPLSMQGPEECHR